MSALAWLDSLLSTSSRATPCGAFGAPHTLKQRVRGDLTPEDQERIRDAVAAPMEEREKPAIAPLTDPKALPGWSIKPLPAHQRKRH